MTRKPRTPDEVRELMRDVEVPAVLAAREGTKPLLQLLAELNRRIRKAREEALTAVDAAFAAELAELQAQCPHEDTFTIANVLGEPCREVCEACHASLELEEP